MLTERDPISSKHQIMSHVDYLTNPLRKDHPFGKHNFIYFQFFLELWSPKEMALFNACICRFEKEFDVFVFYVR
jgi:hypothetical protein